MKYASVTDVVRRIKDDIQKDFRLQSVAMEGNIIGLKRASNGHYYMNLHDDACSIRAILFRNRAGRMMDGIREGDHVVVIGSVNVYEKGGALSFIIERLFSQGIGSLQAEYERIKNELERDGYFDAAHKQAIPRFPWTVGVLTSRTGAVLHDIRKIAAERNPYVDIRLFPIPVQGAGAEEKIAAAVAKAGTRRDLDVLILARGGGSMEDLWAFNEEIVARAIFECRTPIISAVGHETDTTIADYAADFVFRDCRRIVEIFCHEVIVKLGDCLEHLVAHRLALVFQRRWNLFAAVLSTHCLVVPEVSLHCDQVNNTLEGLLCTDWNLDCYRICTEHFTHLTHYLKEVGSRTVHLVDVTDTRHIVFVCLTPYCL